MFTCWSRANPPRPPVPSPSPCSAAGACWVALRIAEEHDLAPLLARCTYNYASTLSSVPCRAEVLTLLDRVDELVETRGVRRLLVAARTLRATEMVWAGDLDGAAKQLERVAREVPVTDALGWRCREWLVSVRHALGAFVLFYSSLQWAWLRRLRRDFERRK